jgi:hypothetical protein
MMSVLKKYIIQPCDVRQIGSFIEKWHYSKNVNGLISDYCFRLLNEKGDLVGAIIYGRIAMRGVWKKYVDNESDLIELRRLVCIDDTPKNTESFFISKTIKWLLWNSNIKKIISYADNTQGHTGVIYKASNFDFEGETMSGKVIEYNGRKYHDKTIRTKYNGQLKPFAIEIKEALKNGSAKYVETKTKNIFTFDLEKRRTRTMGIRQQKLF